MYVIQRIVHIGEPRWRFRYAMLGCVLLLNGCANTQTREAFQFDPFPSVEVSEQELEPIARQVTDLLHAAQSEFERANRAHEKGDDEASYRHYTAMLELMAEADLDPTIFYNLRSEFGRILNMSERQARARKVSPGSTTPDLALETKTDLDYPYPFPERVLIQIDRILKLYPQHYAEGLRRSSKYMPFIRQELRKAGMPEDLAWLAMVESQYTPRIVSHAGAGGMWQFMKSTGRRYGLRIDYYVDERYDWQIATKAAIAYLGELYDVFDGSWPLAVSAYNMGERGLERAIAANGGERNLWTLIETPPAANRIRRETKNFYSKLLASAIVGENPERYGFFTEFEKPMDTELVTVKGSYGLAEIEKAAGLQWGAIQKLNPQLIRSLTPPDGEYRIYVPASKRIIVASALKDVPKFQPGTHIVRRGDTPGDIARQYNVNTAELMRINNIRSARHLQIGQRLVVPGREGQTRKGSSTQLARDGRSTYKVKRNDTLSEIATRYKVGVRDLQRWNNLGRSTRIHIGDTLRVASPPGTRKATKSKKPKIHVVKAGEFPARIAKRYGLKLGDLLAWNGLTPTSMIRVGDTLKLTAAGVITPAKPKGTVKATQPQATAKRTHRVKSGENPSVIAYQYGVKTSQFLRWNNLTSRSVLHIGDEYTVYVSETTQIANAAEPSAGNGGSHSEPGKKIVHVVTSGQNPWTIARRFGVKLRDLFTWNHWEKTPVLQIGQEIIIFQK